MFDRKVGVKRGYGQAPHDRYILHYRPGIELPGPWKEFVAELQGEAYQSLLRRMLGPQAVHFDDGVVLRVAGMFRLSRTAMPGASWQHISSTSIPKRTGKKTGVARS